MTRQASLLVVDDNELNRDALARRLQQRGYHVTMAASGPEALAVIASAACDLVLLDVEMPEMSGLEVLATIRQTRTRTELPVIMVTARTAGEDVVEALTHGANDYVTKPIDFAVAVARVETHLAHHWAVNDLRESEERYALAVRGANDGLWDWNLITGEVYWSPRWRSILGLETAPLAAVATEWLSRIHPDDLPGVESTLDEHFTSGTGHYENQHRVRHADNTYRWVRCRGAAVRNADGVATRFAGSFTDITDGKLADALTGLPNRLLFLDLVERAIKRSARRSKVGRPYAFAVIVLALDRFRAVHDSLGPAAADALIVAASRRLQAGLRATDVVTHGESGYTLARLGGDEFNVLVDDVTDAADALLVAERLRRALAAPFTVEGHQVFVSARMGIAISTTGYTRPEDVLRDAGIALNRVSTSAPTACEIFDPGMRERAMTRLKIESELRQAIATGAFELHYQPIISLRSGRIAGFEALVRWKHPERGLVQPPEFIGIAEDTGMIVDIDRLTLTDSCKQMASWMASFGATAPGVMCANVSGQQLATSQLMDDIASTLRATGLTPGNLKLEITENAFIHDIPAAQQAVANARRLGVAWALDDFGTGYSSLSFLHRLDVDTVKVDRSFVSTIGSGGNGSEMARAIIGLAHTLGMDVVAEGVETAEQASELRALGCEFAQGFYYSRAVDAAAASRLIEAQPWQRSREQHLVQ
jgi:diguanylate cyclase (GGDEF)-like protein/PAS domain S-box-containing protein